MAIHQSRNGIVTKAHVNLMTDTIIANLPSDGLRSVIRSILTTDPGFTSTFEEHTRRYLQKTASASLGTLFICENAIEWRATPQFHLAQQRVRSMLGSGLCYDSLRQVKFIVDQCRNVQISHDSPSREELETLITSVDGDIVQALTAVQKTLNQLSGQRSLTTEEYDSMDQLFQSLVSCCREWTANKQEFLFDRSLSLVAGILAKPTGLPEEPLFQTHTDLLNRKGTNVTIETFSLGDKVLPRLFSGLWQLSSPSWGVAPKSKILNQFNNFVSKGFTAYDMADHYGDAEVLFGKFRASYPQPDTIFGSTKYCVFQPVKITPSVVHDNISERCRRLKSGQVDLLQFHWQFYEDEQYIAALSLLQEDERVKLLGLCNFDTKRLEEILEAGINVVTNQVQCGGFLAEKWLDKPEPELFSDEMTPSQRKYFEMILAWGGWDLFQELLQALKIIAGKHSVTISNVATRWVLDFEYVGAVIVGARMGVSEHGDENLASYGWRLDEEDHEKIDSVLSKSRRDEIFEVMGDCGGEYR